MSKAVTDGQARSLIASFTIDTPWAEIETDLQPFIELPPTERGKRFAAFLRNGCRIDEAASSIAAAIEAGQTELWLHDDQKIGLVRGRKILQHLTDTGLLDGCVDLDELKAIQAQGIDFFRKHFAGKAVFAWRGVQDDRVPYLVEFYGKVVLLKSWLDNKWGADNPALRRK